MYFQTIGNTDSCIAYYRNVLENGNLMCQYGASKALYQIYYNAGQKDSANHYAAEFIDISAQLDLGGRQELAATVNNQYKYYKNKLVEERMVYERNNYRLRMYLYVCVFVLLLIVGVLSHFWRKSKRVKSLLALNDIIAETGKQPQRKMMEMLDEGRLISTIRNSVEFNKKALVNARDEMNQTLEETLQMRAILKQVQEENMAKKEKLADMENQLKQQKDLLNENIDKLTDVSLRLEMSEKELVEKKDMLTRKMEQNRQLFMSHHQVELESDFGEIVKSIRESSKKKDGVSDFKWKELMTAIDKLYPNFNESLLNKFDNIKTKQIHVCYLLKAGFSNTDIEYIVKDVSRSTIWRWIKTYRETLADEIND